MAEDNRWKYVLSVKLRRFDVCDVSEALRRNKHKQLIISGKMDKFVQFTNNHSNRASCRYGKGCYQTNPYHFNKFTHNHLEQIIAGSLSTNSHHQIPDDLLSKKQLILEQIKIINDLVRKKSTKSAKNRPDESMQQSSSSSLPEVTANSVFSSTDNCTQSKSDELSPDSVSIAQRDADFETNIHNYVEVVNPKGEMAQKLAAARPYNYFLTCVTSSPSTHTEPLSITFQEIFDPSLGDLECSVQINFVVEADWLLGQYYFAGCLNKPLLILYGMAAPQLEAISKIRPNITAHFVKMQFQFATHHTKMMLLGYTDGSMRVVISTANLYYEDWHNRTQGLWMSDKLEALPDGCDTATGESPTKFRNELLTFLSSYKLHQLKPWLARIRKTDFSLVRQIYLFNSISGISQILNYVFLFTFR